MGKRIVSALLWVMMTAAVLALILGICYGNGHVFVATVVLDPLAGYVTLLLLTSPLLCFATFKSGL